MPYYSSADEFVAAISLQLTTLKQGFHCVNFLTLVCTLKQKKKKNWMSVILLQLTVNEFFCCNMGISQYLNSLLNWNIALTIIAAELLRKRITFIFFLDIRFKILFTSVDTETLSTNLNKKEKELHNYGFLPKYVEFYHL